MNLRFASYNVHKCVGLDRRRKPGRIVEVINELKADVVALQEVDLRLGKRPAALPLHLVEQETDFHVPDFSPESPSLGWHGQAILLRHGVEISEIRRILLPGLEPRGALMAEVLREGRSFRIVAAHLGLLRRYRLMQMAAIRAAISVRARMPTVILGDFNEWSARNGMAPLTDAYRVHAPGRSFPAARPIGSLDRIALSEGWHLKDAGVHLSGLSRIASDHLPIWADVRLSAGD